MDRKKADKKEYAERRAMRERTETFIDDLILYNTTTARDKLRTTGAWKAADFYNIVHKNVMDYSGQMCAEDCG